MPKSNIDILKEKIFKPTYDEESGKKWEIVFKKSGETFTVRLTIYNGTECTECSYSNSKHHYEINANNVKSFEDLCRLFLKSSGPCSEISKMFYPEVESIEEIF